MILKDEELLCITGGGKSIMTGIAIALGAVVTLFVGIIDGLVVLFRQPMN